MKRLTTILLITATISSCVSKPQEETTGLLFSTGGPEETNTVTVGSTIPDGFEWETIKYQAIEVNNTNTTVYNSKGELIADDLPMGSYILPMRYNDSIVAVQEINITLAPSLSGSYSNSDGQDNLLYFPSKGQYGTFMAEDLFPYRGDRDFNDVVFGFNYSYNIASDGKSVKQMIVSISPRAIGGNAQEIGVGLKFYSSSLKIASVEGSSVSNSGLFGTLNNNGTENGQHSCTVVPILDDLRSHFDENNGFLNTFKDHPQISSSNINVIITFEEGYYPAYNDLVQHIGSEDWGVSLFITIDNRSKEIFSKGNTPTDKFDTELFRTTGKEDFSDSDNFVWAIQSTEFIAHPAEMMAITNAYPSIADWMLSGGKLNSDWYLSPDNSSLF